MSRRRLLQCLLVLLWLLAATSIIVYVMRTPDARECASQVGGASRHVVEVRDGVMVPVCARDR